MATDRTGWPEYLDHVKPVLDLLQSKGLTVGEALIVVELNALQNHLRVQSEGINNLNGTVSQVVDAIRRASQDPDDTWKGGG